jgi:hypothetical protein
LIVSDVVGFFGVDCLPSSLALSPGQAQAVAAGEGEHDGKQGGDGFHV